MIDNIEHWQHMLPTNNHDISVWIRSHISVPQTFLVNALIEESHYWEHQAKIKPSDMPLSYKLIQAFSIQNISSPVGWRVHPSEWDVEAFYHGLKRNFGESAASSCTYSPYYAGFVLDKGDTKVRFSHLEMLNLCGIWEPYTDGKLLVSEWVLVDEQAGKDLTHLGEAVLSVKGSTWWGRRSSYHSNLDDPLLRMCAVCGPFNVT